MAYYRPVIMATRQSDRHFSKLELNLWLQGPLNTWPDTALKSLIDKNALEPKMSQCSQLLPSKYNQLNKGPLNERLTCISTVI